MKKRILKFWCDTEIFNLPNFAVSEREKFSPLELQKPLPWIRKDQKKGYTLFFGRIEKKKIVEAIENAYGGRVDYDWVEPVNGFTYISSITLTYDGRPDFQSYTQPSFFLGLKCIVEKKPISDSEISSLRKTELEQFEKRNSVEPQKEPEPWTASQINEELSRLKSSCSLLNIEIKSEIYFTLTNSSNEGGDKSFLDSFFYEDLSSLIQQNTKFGRALERYLSEKPVFGEQTDLLKNRAVFASLLDPCVFPASRWPSKPTYGLYSAQQAAVNQVFEKLKDHAGLIGINGPPGTGKTTLLQDVVAEVVVTRAKKLINADIQKMFSSQYKNVKDNFGYYEINSPALKDSGIVIASNNNAAVENISKELPARKKIDEKEFANASYFAGCFDELLGLPSWGILSAPLGKKENRVNLQSKFWEKNSDAGRKGFKQLLGAKPQSSLQSVADFNRVKLELNGLLTDWSIFQKEASNVHRQRESHQQNLKRRDVIDDEIKNVRNQIDKATIHQIEITKAIEELNLQHTDILRSVSAHKQLRPLFFAIHKFLNTIPYKKWYATLYSYQQEMNIVLEKKAQKESLKKKNERWRKDQEKEELDLMRERDRILREIKLYENQIEMLCEKFDLSRKNILDSTFFDLQNIDFHRSNPYSSEKINRLRSSIFLKSLELHEHAILANAGQFGKNLELFFKMISGTSVEVSPALTLTLWNTFFFCIPVVSTTLASVSRLFKNMGKESIGWLLIDEAGQATPQSAAGIIWRSKRCVIVGDPLQIEPVSDHPQKLIAHLLKENRVDSIWSPLESSVQLLADRVSEVGTYMASENEPNRIWTGFPLRTHRRCNNPMFQVSNKIAYSGQMVKAEKDGVYNCILGPSAWFHIDGQILQNKHVIKEEILHLKVKVDELRSSGYTEEVFVISPFKSVATACKGEVDNHKGVSCGTVHTFQGKEADIVFLVLGGNPSKSGARTWASSKPNILNVAITRARKRLYVIGNKNLWGNCKYFNVLASDL